MISLATKFLAYNMQQHILLYSIADASLPLIVIVVTIRLLFLKWLIFWRWKISENETAQTDKPKNSWQTWRLLIIGLVTVIP
jgi:hypothetical protein